MEGLHIVTPVKDSIDATLQTIKAVMASQLDMRHTYTVYNDFSTPENTAILQQASNQMGFQLVNISDLTTHQSPNYLFILQRERKLCLEENCGLLIVESDVTVTRKTLQGLWDETLKRPDTGIAASITVDDSGEVNYPYLFMKGNKDMVKDTSRHCSFCCSLLTPKLMRLVNFDKLDSKKNWFDVCISHLSLKAGLHNYIFACLPVLHCPHSSRPWKLLKYKNPIKYYWIKYTRGFDKI